MVENCIVHNSCSSFITNFFLGLTNVDRIKASVTMLPTRFLSADRIIAGSLPDIDMNLAGREIFIETQREMLGEKNSYWMAALTKLKEKSAFKIYAKSQMVDFTTTNAITAALEQYEKAVKNLSDDDQLIDEEDGHEIDVYDYIPKEYHEIYNYSKKYQGIIDAVSPHPCAFLVTNDPITRSFGLMRVKDEIVCMVEGGVADSWKYVKNDLLSVSVYSLIGNTFARIGKPILSVSELIEATKYDEKVWKIYEEGYTMCRFMHLEHVNVQAN